MASFRQLRAAGTLFLLLQLCHYAAGSSAQNHISAQHLRMLAANGPEPHVLILSTASCAYKSMVVNFMMHWERLNRHGQVLMIAEDQCIYDFIVSDIGRVHTIPAVSNLTDMGNDFSGDYGSRNFNALSNRRLHYILHGLRIGVPVLFVDLDVVFFRDPFQFIPMGFDVVLQHDGPMPFPGALAGPAGEFTACTCFLFFTPTWGSINLMQRWIAKMLEVGYDSFFDQRHLNNALKECQMPQCPLRAMMMPSSVLPSGAISDGIRGKYARVAWAHANWRQGLENKIKFLKQQGAWLAQDPSPPPPPPSPPAATPAQ